MMKPNLPLMCLFAALLASPAYAQTAPVTPAAPPTEQLPTAADTAETAGATSAAATQSILATDVAMNRIVQSIRQDVRDNIDGKVVRTPEIPSLFFTPEQYAALQEAKQGFNFKPAADTSEAELYNEGNFIREISLQGILYKSPNDWIVWFNNARMTPKNLPPEVSEFKVHKNYVELKWFDRRTDTVVPVRLRPNQRFNLDAKVFLPGKSDPADLGGGGGLMGIEPIDLGLF